MKHNIGTEETAALAAESLAERKAEDIVTMDLRGTAGGSMADFFVLATGKSPPQLKAMSEEVEKCLKEKGQRVYRRAGVAEGGWIVLDYVDVVVHVFSAEARGYYAIEDLWQSNQESNK